MSTSSRPSTEATGARSAPVTTPLAPIPQKPAPVEFDPAAPLGDVIDAVLQGCLDHLLANRRAARALEDPEGIHQLRVAVRRTRSTLRLFRKRLAVDATRALRADLDWIGGALSPARDWDVFCVETLAEVRHALADVPGLRRLGWEAELCRLTAHQAAREALDAQRFDLLVLRLDRFVRGGEWRLDLPPERLRRLDRSGRRFAARCLDEHFVDVRLLDRPFRQLCAPELHALRIRVKRFRYASESLAPLFPGKRARRVVKRLRALQDALGRINDGRVADALVERLLEQVDPATRARLERSAGVVSGWSHARAVRERADIEPLWQTVAGGKPFWR